MVIFEQTLRDLLIQMNLVDDRVFLMRAPQVPADKQKTPYVVFFSVAPINTLLLTTHNGPLDQIERDYQISVFDNSQSRALAIADSIRIYLHTLHGDFENVRIGHSFYMTQTWAWEPDTLLYQVIQEFRIMFSYLSLDPPPVTPTRRSKRNEHHNAATDAEHHAAAPAACNEERGTPGAAFRPHAAIRRSR
jgi:hypothetical protein